MSQRIIEALLKLDVNNDDHWTDEGLPRLDAMKDILGETVSRVDVTNAAKGFTRKTTDVLKTPTPGNPDQTLNGQIAALEGQIKEPTGSELNPGAGTLREHLQSVVAERAAAVQESAANLAEMQKAHQELVQQHDEALEELEALDGDTPAERNVNLIAQYLEAQRKQREEG